MDLHKRTALKDKVVYLNILLIVRVGVTAEDEGKGCGSMTMILKHQGFRLILVERCKKLILIALIYKRFDLKYRTKLTK